MLQTTVCFALVAFTLASYEPEYENRYHPDRYGRHGYRDYGRYGYNDYDHYGYPQRRFGYDRYGYDYRGKDRYDHRQLDRGYELQAESYPVYHPHTYIKYDEKCPYKAGDYTYRNGYAETAPMEKTDSDFCKNQPDGQYANPGLCDKVDPRCTFIQCASGRTFIFNCALGSFNGLSYKHHCPAYGSYFMGYYYRHKYQSYGVDFCHVNDDSTHRVCRRN